MASSEQFIRAMWDAFADPALQKWVKSVDPNMVLGPWSPQGNILDHLDQQRFDQLKNDVASIAASRDPEILKIIKGFNTMLGGQWGPEQEAQAKNIQGNVAAVAPTLMRWAPDWWDEMHGGAGSLASLASAIADVNQHNPDFTAEDAVRQAEEMSELMADPLVNRGFSGRELGKLYREAAKRGLVNRFSDVETAVKDITPIIGAVSAVRDVVGPGDYDTSDIPGMFTALDVMAPTGHYDFSQLEQDIRANNHLQNRGGLFGAAMAATGQTVQGAGVSQAQLSRDNAQLTAQARRSPVSNMLAATARARDAGLIRPGSAADTFLNDALAGNLKPISEHDWRQMMRQSGADPAAAAVLRNQPGANQLFLDSTPEYAQLPMTVRMHQGAFDHQRQFEQLERQYRGMPAAVLDGAKTEYVQRLGYKDFNHYNALQGPAAKQLQNVWNNAQTSGNVARNWSHLGWRGPVQRVTDEIKNGTQSPWAIGAAAAGAVRVPPTFPKAAMEKEAIRGLPDRTQFGNTSDLPTDSIVDLFVQRHKAQRAGEHYDLRIGNPQTGLYSWATKPPRLPAPGEKRFMRQQPIHSHRYGSFSGTIGSGYGKGEVRKEQQERILITKATPTKIEYTIASRGVPERYVLMKPNNWKEREWLLMNVTPTKKVPYDKVKYKKIPAEAVEKYIDQMQTGTSAQAKLDGASSLIKLMKGGAEVLSYRVHKDTGHPIVHTERMFGTRPKLDIPKKYQGTVLKGELYGQKGDKVIPPQQLGGLLHNTIEHSLQNQRNEGIEIKNMLYDIQQLGNKHLDQAEVPYAERRKLLEEVLPYLPADKFHLAEEVHTPEAAKAMWRQIVEGTHPLTREGIVFHPPVGRPVKAKPLEESDVYITSIFPGTGRLRGTGAGGFEYALEPGGLAVGKVGTGLSDVLRQQMWKNPNDFIGRVARIHSQEQHPSGAWRAPALLALHEDYPVKEPSL